jgi:predicted outer membrane repeat protein
MSLRKVWRSGLCLILLGVLLIPAAPARAGGVVGNGTPGSCTDAALTAALLGGGTVAFLCGGPATIVLQSEKVITRDTVIQGGGVITLTGGLATRLFRVEAPAALALTGLLLDGGHSAGNPGGAILNNGSLSLADVTVQNSQTGSSGCGGAIMTTGAVTIADSRFSNNAAGTAGGALCASGAAPFNVEIANSSFESNQTVRATLGFGYGGAIYLDPLVSLRLVGGRFSQNTAQFGGALAVTVGATATLASGHGDLTTAFFENTASDSGGAIYSQGSLALDGVRFSQNSAREDLPALGYGGGVASLGTLVLAGGDFQLNRGRFGGGLFVGGNAGLARAEVRGTRFAYNSAAGLGGGLYINFASTVITVTQSAFFRNSAVTSGGGVARSDGQLQIWNASFRANTAGTGGGLFVGPGSSYVRVRSVTFAGNEANNNRGGGVHNQGRLELYFTTLVSNTNGVLSTLGGNTRLRSAVLHNPGALNCDGDGSAQPSNDSANHISDSSCGPQFTALGDPQLGPLLFDSAAGYFSYYHLPLAGSPLINAGYHACPERDQRGALRPDACDIGAVEFGGLLPRVVLPLLLWTQ